MSYIYICKKEYADLDVKQQTNSVSFWEQWRQKQRAGKKCQNVGALDNEVCMRCVGKNTRCVVNTYLKRQHLQNSFRLNNDILSLGIPAEWPTLAGVYFFCNVRNLYIPSGP